jgi:hypothetical protein
MTYDEYGYDGLGYDRWGYDTYAEDILGRTYPDDVDIIEFYSELSLAEVMEERFWLSAALLITPGACIGFEDLETYEQYAETHPYLGRWER